MSGKGEDGSDEHIVGLFRGGSSSFRHEFPLQSVQQSLVRTGGNDEGRRRWRSGHDLDDLLDGFRRLLDWFHHLEHLSRAFEASALIFEKWFPSLARRCGGRWGDSGRSNSLSFRHCIFERNGRGQEREIPTASFLSKQHGLSENSAKLACDRLQLTPARYRTFPRSRSPLKPDIECVYLHFLSPRSFPPHASAGPADRLDHHTEVSDAIVSYKGNGKLQGTPYAVKDIFCTRSLPTTAASRMLQGGIPILVSLFPAI